MAGVQWSTRAVGRAEVHDLVFVIIDFVPGRQKATDRQIEVKRKKHTGKREPALVGQDGHDLGQSFQHNVGHLAPYSQTGLLQIVGHSDADSNWQ